MRHTKAYLTDITKKKVYEIARDIATEKGTTGISKYNKDKLIEFILENQSEKPAQAEVEEQSTEQTQNEQPIEFTSVPTPEEFFNLVKDENDKVKVNQACNALLDKLVEEKYSTATISRKLSGYKKPFYDYQHSNPKLNETVTVKGVTKTQHIAANLLTLSEEQSSELAEQRQQTELSRRGIDEEGNIRDVELPPQRIKSIVEKACSLLSSTKPLDIACGLLPLTGLRRNEQNMPAIEYDNGVITREWKVIGEFLIAIKGLSKKGGNDSWFARATLAPAQMIVDAQKIFLSHPKVQTIPSNYKAYSDGAFRKAVDRRFKEFWNEEFSTIEAYDDNGNKIKNNASTHKARAFYTWALVPVLKANGFNQKQAKLYIKECLGHDDEKDTSKYFNRYDEDQFIAAIDISIPTNFKEIGQMSQTTVERLNKAYYDKNETEEIQAAETEETTETEETLLKGLDVAKFIDGIPEDLQIKFNDLVNKGVDITTALIQIVNTARNTESQTEKAPPVSDKISEILTAIMEYNGEQPEIKNYLIPTYAACNRISKIAYGKEIARSTFEEVWRQYGRDIVERLEKKEIPNISREDAKQKGVVSQEMWNGKYHRKDMDVIISKVVSLLDYQ